MKEVNRETLLEKINYLSAVSKLGLSLNDEYNLATYKMLLATMEAEPYGYVHQSVYEQSGSCGLSNDHEAYRDSKTHIPVYRHAEWPRLSEGIISELEQVRDWILNTLPVPTPLTIPNVRRLTTVINACRMVNQK